MIQLSSQIAFLVASCRRATANYRNEPNSLGRRAVGEAGTTSAVGIAPDFGSLWTVIVAGVEFIDENGGGPGLRLRKRPQRKG